MLSSLSLAESYLTVQSSDFSVGFDQKIIISRKRLVVRLVGCAQVLGGKLKHIVVVDVHPLRRLSLVLARAIVIALIVIKLVRLRARSLPRAQNVMRTLSRPQDSRASDAVVRNRMRRKILDDGKPNAKEKQKQRKISTPKDKTEQFVTSND